MPGRLTTHVLDTAHGCPAAGMQIELWSLNEPKPRLLKTSRTNSDGRADQPLLNSEEMKQGLFELVFLVGDYFKAKTSSLPDVLFLDRIPVRFGIADIHSTYHVPLLVSPWAYTTYRGS